MTVEPDAPGRREVRLWAPCSMTGMVQGAGIVEHGRPADGGIPMFGRDGRGSARASGRRRAFAALAFAMTLAGCGAGGPPVSPTIGPTVTPAGAPTATPFVVPSDVPTPLPSTSHALPTGALGQLAFIQPVTDIDVEPDVWLATVWPGAGTADFRVTTVRLTNTPGVELALAWSPDGQRLAFIRRTEATRSLWSIQADGSGQVLLATDVNDSFVPSWSPDGGRIAFLQERDDLPGISVASAQGTDVVRLTDELTDAPAWSPVGDLIAFRQSFYVDLDHPGTSSLWLMRPDGSSQRALTSGPEAVTSPFAWSPDGSRIAFGRYAAHPPTDGTGTSLRVIAVDGGTETELTDGSTSDHDPAWAPSGTLLLFVRTFDVGPEHASADLWVVNADGSGAHKLLDSDTTDFGATWSPDGKLIVCMAESGPAGGGIAILSADGTRMAIVEHDASLPAWRPGT